MEDAEKTKATSVFCLGWVLKQNWGTLLLQLWKLKN